MSLFHIFLVAVLQGVTEFLPVSSSGHLILLPGLTGLEDQGQAIDVAVHVGTLGAVVIYFWRDVRLALSGLGALLRGRFEAPGARLAAGLMLATLPVILFGLFLKLTGLDDSLRSIAVIGWTMLVFGILLYVVDQVGATHRDFEEWSLKNALVMGLWQAVALIPGTSRSGITITAARWLGFNREDGTRLAMLMSIPTILASGILLGAEVAMQADAQTARDGAIAAAFAFVSALVALWAMMRLLRIATFTPYVIYRVVLGVILLWIAYT